MRGSAGSLVVGLLILLGVLVVLAGLTTRRVPRAVLPAAGVLVLAATIASASAAVAKGGLVSWQRWDPYTAPQPPVGVSFVWDAQYNGITFPRKRTTVLEVKAPRRSLYWRAAVLDEFTRDRWEETLPLRADALVPSNGKPLLRQDVRILALADTHLVGASVPLRYDAGDAPLVSHVPGIASLPSGLTRGFRYTAWSYAPRPTAAQLARVEAGLSRPAHRARDVSRRLASRERAAVRRAATRTGGRGDPRVHAGADPLRAAPAPRDRGGRRCALARTRRRLRSSSGSASTAALRTRTIPRRRRARRSSTSSRRRAPGTASTSPVRWP